MKSVSKGKAYTHQVESTKCILLALATSTVFVTPKIDHILAWCAYRMVMLRLRRSRQTLGLCGPSLGRGNESLYKWSRSHDQLDGRRDYK